MRIHMNISRPIPLVLLVTVCLLSSTGCGGEKVVSVSGTVTHNGQPVPGLVVSFVPEAATKTGVSIGETDDNGKYDLTVVKTKSRGAVVGTHKVWVSLPREEPPPPGGERENERVKKKPPASKSPPADFAATLKRYGSLDRTPLTVEVNGGQPIDLKLD